MEIPAPTGEPALRQRSGGHQAPAALLGRHMTTTSVVDDLTVQRTGTIDPDGVAAVASFLGVRLNIRAGDALPSMWHGFFLLDRWRHDELGPDGHPERG